MIPSKNHVLKINIQLQKNVSLLKSDFGVKAFIFGMTFIVLSSCSPKDKTQSIDYGSQNDSARYFMLKGYEEILDHRRWTLSEENFRKASSLDPDWLLAKSLVARNTRDLQERKELLNFLKQHKDQAKGNEALLLEVNMLLVQAYNNRDQGIQDSVFTQTMLKVAESNLGEFITKYPEDDYFKAEYIEVINAIYGPKVGLDSLNDLTSERQKDLAFYIAYAGEMHLDLGQTEKAIELSKRLKEKRIDSTYANYPMLKARIYFAQDSINKAKSLVDRVIELDSNNIYALRLQHQLEEQIH